MRPHSGAEEYLARLVHAIRPSWTVPGIRASFTDRPDLTLAELVEVALVAAYDKSAETPGVIRARQSVGWLERPHEKTAPQPQRIGDVLQAPRQADDVAHRGRKLVQAEIEKARRTDDDEW